MIIIRLWHQRYRDMVHTSRFCPLEQPTKVLPDFLQTANSVLVATAESKPRKFLRRVFFRLYCPLFYLLKKVELFLIMEVVLFLTPKFFVTFLLPIDRPICSTLYILFY